MLKLIRVALFVTVLGAILFASAGRWNVPGFWAYLVVAGLVGAFAVFTIDDPALVRERRRPGPGGIDGGLRFFAAPLLAVHFIVAGVDVGRYAWSRPPALALQAAALVGCGASLAVTFWAMALNRFFSSVVRLQTERGHHVITAGPYRMVRHPGHLGMTSAFTLSGIALGSWWSILPALIYVGLVLRRTVIEDRFLLEKLAGYRDYAATVRWRLLPLVW